MTESTKAIKSLKRAANYSKLAMHELGPRSFKKGQGALMKVIAKFGEDGTIDKKKLERMLGWKGGEVRKVCEKAQRNGYVAIDDSGFEFTVKLTDKGNEVLQKRFAVEDHAADAVMAGLTPEEVDQLVALCEKISTTCEGLGVDYSLIEKRQRGCRRGQRDERGEGKGRKDRCCGHHGHDHGCCKHHHDAPQYVFVFGDDHGHGCHHHDDCERHGKKHGRR